MTPALRQDHLIAIAHRAGDDKAQPGMAGDSRAMERPAGQASINPPST
jgi:hypothetical protein